jgi:hypothetical protein
MTKGLGMSTSTYSLDDLIAMLQPDVQALEDGRRRMIDVWHGRPTDSLPILFGVGAPEGVTGGGDMVRHFTDDEQMLYDTVVGLLGAARAGSDIQLTIRANTGTGTFATAAGCELLPSEFALPWTTHVSRAALEAFHPEEMNLAEAGIFPRVKRLYAYFRSKLPACVHLFCADSQSPFDLAHLLYGDPIFYDMYDDPDFVHALLRKATYLYIEGTKLIKGWMGEPLDGGYHWGMAVANGGTRSCEDTPTLLNEEAIAEFVHPYRAQGLAPFGGGFVHYCGDNAHLYRDVLSEPMVNGLNFGNPERHDMGQVIADLIAAGKCYWGSIPRDDDETLEAYFARVIGYTQGTRTGLIFTPSLRGDEWNEPERVVGVWRELQ